jgi:hypothetical protein
MATNTLFDGDAYWNDSWVQELDGDEERLYHFYITSPNLDKSGVYKQTERSIGFYVHGFGMERIREITEKFTKAKKVIRCGEWIIVPSSLKHQNYKNNQKVITSIIEYLKKLPSEVFEELRKCDYPLDLDAIIPPKKAKTDDPSPVADDLSSKTDDLSMTYPYVTDDLPLKTDESNIIQSNITESNIIQGNADADTLSAHFIQRWQQNADVFNCLARLKHPADWKSFWEQNTMTLEQIDLAIDNFIEGVKNGAIERFYIPRSPDGFVLNGWLQTCMEPVKKKNGQGQHIANDHVDDVSKYFKEI